MPRIGSSPSVAPTPWGNHRQEFRALGRARDALVTALHQADGEVPQLRYLVRAVERELYKAAEALALASAAPLNDAYDAGLELVEASNHLLRAAGYALAATARAPELHATRDNGPWASHVDRYR